MIAKGIRPDTRIPVRTIFELSDIQKSDPTSVLFDAVSTTEVHLRPHATEAEIATNLHAWTLGVLTSGFYELGLYSASCMSVDAGDHPIATFGSIYLAWDGRAELAYGTWLPPISRLPVRERLATVDRCPFRCASSRSAMSSSRNSSPYSTSPTGTQ